MHRTRMKLIFVIAVSMLLANAAWAADALTFFNNWFVTGDYNVTGIGLRGKGVNGWATGTMLMSGVPNGAEPIAAFLYWSTVETSTTPGSRKGYFNGYQIQGVALGNPQSPNPPCWGSDGSIGPAGTAGFVYRADVLRYLPVDSNNVRQANGYHTVQLPDSGGIGNGPITNGASLLVIYRIVTPSDVDKTPLRAVVIYNGAYTMNKQTAPMTQNIAGFYQAASANSAAKMTDIVANGQTAFSESFTVNGSTLDSKPFVGRQGTRWDSTTYNILATPNTSSLSTMVTALTNQTCLTFAAIVVSVNVQDSDGDGLLDVWESKGLHRNTQVSPATFGTCADYPGEPCVNLPAMGANPNKKDVFVQIDWMHGTGDGTGGTDHNGTHDHRPNLDALSAVASAFSAHAVNLHFDVGKNYQGPQSACGNVPCSFIIPSAYAQGGSDIDESSLVCHDTAKHTCDYHVPYPVLSFEFGFASIRDGNHLLNTPAHFAQNRKDVFHYSLFAHALAGPYDVKGHPIDPFTGQQTDVPKSYSGIAHRPGGGFMVTLGLWRSDTPAFDQVGSSLVQSGTFMHELGHNLGLGHAGWYTRPNCAPNYPSVMNYLYQTRGLTDGAGNKQIDYSNGLLLQLNENLLSGAYMGPQRYRVRYYGPLAPNQPASQAAALHCDGTPIQPGEPFEVRLEGLTIAPPDWSNGTVAKGHSIARLDVNYDGTVGQLFTDQPDWSSLNLQQIGSGYSFGGLSVGAFATDGGAFATDAGAFATDAGALATDGGAFATDGGAFATDGGAFATDGGAFATDGGAFATDGGAFATDAGDVDQDTALLSSVDPPDPVSAVNQIDSILATWTPPATGKNLNYNVYRCAGAGCTPSGPAFANVTGGSSMPFFKDMVNDFVHAGATCPAGATCYNTTYVYAVTTLATINAKVAESLFSKTITSEVTHLFVIADAQPSVVYGGTNPTPTFKIYGDVQGSLAGVSCAYSPAPARNAATYQIVCSGPATTSATDGVTYNQPYLNNTPGTFTITKRPITVTAAASTKTYDGLLSSPATPTITSGTLAYADTTGWIETYDNKNAGTTHVMTPGGAVDDGNGGNNYNVTFLTINTGVIKKAPASVTPNPASKTYGAPDPVFTGILSGFVAADNITATYTRTAGEAVAGSPYTIGATLSPAGALGNYNVTYNSANFTINKAPASVTPNPASKTYGTSDPALTGTLSGFILADNITATYTRTAGETVAGTPYTISATLSPSAALVNYTITYNTANFTITKANASVTPNPASKTYGAADPALSGTLSGFIAADGITAAYSRAPGETVAGSPYALSAALSPVSALSNYNITYNAANFTINKAPVMVGLSNMTQTYTGSPLAPTVTTTPSGISYSLVGAPGTNAGSYPVTATVTDPNYSGSAMGMFVIDRYPLTVSATGVNKSFDGTANATVTLSDNRVYAGDTFTDNYMSASFADANPGVNKTVTVRGIAISGPGAANYALTSDSAVAAATISNSIDLTAVTRNGSTQGIPALIGTTLRMTNNTGEVSSAWLPNPVAVTSGFTTSFRFKITGITSPLADGFAFVIQNNPNGTALGATAGGGLLGYSGIPNSIAIEFDTFQNGGAGFNDPAGDHIGIQSNGQLANSPDHQTAANRGGPFAATFSDGNEHTATVSYNFTTHALSVSLDGNAVGTATVDLSTLFPLQNGASAYIGFTASTGADGELMDFLSWSWN